MSHGASPEGKFEAVMQRCHMRECFNQQLYRFRIQTHAPSTCLESENQSLEVFHPEVHDVFVSAENTVGTRSWLREAVPSRVCFRMP